MPWADAILSVNDNDGVGGFVEYCRQNTSIVFEFPQYIQNSNTQTVVGVAWATDNTSLTVCLGNPSVSSGFPLKHRYFSPALTIDTPYMCLPIA